LINKDLARINEIPKQELRITICVSCCWWVPSYIAKLQSPFFQILAIHVFVTRLLWKIKVYVVVLMFRVHANSSWFNSFVFRRFV